MEASIGTLIQQLKDILAVVKRNIDEDDFNKKPGKYLGCAITIYAEFLKENKVSSFKEFLEKVTIDGKSNIKLQSLAEELWELEETWDRVLKTTIANKVY